MTSIELKRLARRIARLEQGQANMSKPQLAYSSIENGNIKSYEGDNLKMSIGLQDDGSSTMRFFDGPVPPVPAGFTALADGPLIQGTWDGSFVDGQQATYDLAYLEVAATLVDDGTRVAFATITAKEGASASVVANQSGLWAVAVRSVSQAGKKSEFASAGTVEVKLVDLAGAIEAVQDSANGKNKVTYSSHAPTEADPGIFDDTWFVGQVGRPNDVVEATNLALNPSMTSLRYQRGSGNMYASSGSAIIVSPDWADSGATALKIEPTGTTQATAAFAAEANNVASSSDAGKTITVSGNFHLDTPQTGATAISRARRIEIRCRVGSTTTSGFALSEEAPNVAGTTRLSVTFTLPSDLHSWFFLLWNGSQYESAFWDSISIQEGTGSTYFDGDTPDGATDNDPHYRWTGTPHASTSEKYLPALDIGESSNWNIIEQYRHDGTGWVKVELSHYVFSTVDLGKATVGELDGIRIMAETISGRVLKADAIDGMVITGPTIQSGRSGRRWIGDPNGIRIINEDNDVRTQLSPDGSTFKGEVEAETLVVNEGAEFKGNNTLAQGAKLTLAAGVTDPTAPPVVQPYWDGLEFTPVSMNASAPVGLAWDGTNYITVGANRTTGGVANYFTGVYAMKINGTTGVASQFRCDFSAGALNEQRVSEVFGVTCIGSELFFLGRYGYAGYVWVTDLAGAFKRRMDYPELNYSSTNPLTYRPGIGNDGTNIVIAHCFDAGHVGIYTYNKTTGAVISLVRDTSDSTRSDITGVYVGNADWGRKLVTVAKKNNAKLPSFNATTGVYDGAATQFDAASPESVGVVYVDGKFRTLDPAGVIHEYADPNTGDGSDDWWATYYWYTDVDNDNVIESSDYRSRMAPPTRFVWPRRAMLKILGQPMPTGVGALGPALAKKASTPTRTDFHGPGWSVDDGKPSARYITLPTDWTTFASPSDTNTFPEATSSALESASGTFQVKGDGSGHWGPLTMGRNGIMSGLIVTGWVTMNVDTPGTAKPYTINLPAGRFSKPPVVWAQPSTSVPRLVGIGIDRGSITTSTFTLHFDRTTTTDTIVAWFAMDSE